MRRWYVGSIVVFIGLTGVFLFRYLQVRSSPAFIPQSSTFELQPPAQATTATLSQSQGEVEQLTREVDEYQEATPGGSIRQGEAIATKRGSATITLDTLGRISMGSKAEISLVNLIPEALMFRQKSGTISYEVNSVHPFSIRALHTLLTLAGDGTISVDEPIVNIRLTKGTAKLALVDTENNTNIWNLVEGQLAQINNQTRVVVLRK